MNADVVIVGAGPAGIFTALELLRRGSPEKIVMIEQGQAIENRRCPKAKTGQCMNCKPYCHITTGFSGAGAFSDGKLSLCSDVGGDLPTLVGERQAQELINYADSIYLEFGADEHVEGLENTEEVKRIRTRAIRAGLRLVDCPIRHLGTEKAHEVYLGIENYLRDHGVEMLFGCTCEDVILRDGRCCGVVAHDGHQDYTIEARHTVIATGRRGADWLEKVCLENGVEHKPGTVDIGVRVEVRNEVMESVNRVLYESKLIGYPAPFKNKVRTFCQNPGGFVSQENYDNDLAVVNGHAYKGAQVAQHERGHPLLAQLLRAVQPADRLRAEGRRADEYARRGPHHGAALRRYPRRQAHLAEGARAVERPPHAAGRRRGRHHVRYAVPRHAQYHQLHQGHGRGRARLCRL